jgi:hypothetical protein
MAGINIVQIAVEYNFKHHAWIIGGCVSTFVSVKHFIQIHIVYDLINDAGR